MRQPIKSERCVMDLLSASDLEAASTLFTNHDTRLYLGGVLSKDDAILHLQAWLKDERSEYYSVYLKDHFELIGLVYLTPYHDHDRTELSYEFLPQYWGIGYAREVISAMLTYCFEVRKLYEVVAETQMKNVASRKLLEKLGYQLEKEVFRFGEYQAVYVKRRI